MPNPAAAYCVMYLVATLSLLWGQRRIIRRMNKMDQATQDLFTAANAKIDTLTGSVQTLAQEFVVEKKKLDAALAGTNTDDIRVAAQALSDKLDGAIKTAQDALSTVNAADPTASAGDAPATTPAS